MPGTIVGVEESAVNKEQTAESPATPGLVKLCPGGFENKRKKNSPRKGGGQTQS